MNLSFKFDNMFYIAFYNELIMNIYDEVLKLGDLQ